MDKNMKPYEMMALKNKYNFYTNGLEDYKELKSKMTDKGECDFELSLAEFLLIEATRLNAPIE